MLKLKEAREELGKKSYRDIQIETAWRWASRAVVSFENVVLAEKKDKVTIWTVSVEYQQEAIEHAGVVEDPVFLQEIIEAMEQSEEKAAEDIESSFGVEL